MVVARRCCEVHREPRRLREALGHPQQRDVGQRAVLVAAADVGVAAGEPDLLDDLARRQRGALLDGPQRRAEGPARLVDGKSVQADIDDGRQLGVVESKQLLDEAPPDERDAEVADRVPHGHALDAHGEVCASAQRLHPRGIASELVALVAVPCVVDRLRRLRSGRCRRARSGRRGCAPRTPRARSRQDRSRLPPRSSRTGSDSRPGCGCRRRSRWRRPRRSARREPTRWRCRPRSARLGRCRRHRPRGWRRCSLTTLV